ncbi:flagellar hook-length control protein FliK [Luteimonas granuli]|uniref:Flagellar hook-length control protein FliK n=1 Tax=Luteimonas granuli TaxID=1176533 RepID=A0A518N0U9_9GAMM|nr:flagellar hook-length control protein FliK [Luteimonas granuli]QDW65547.1 flagellar hook-length control protein FliK [Luteimonas granuli]
MRSQDFSERFGAQLQWMADQNIGHARIRVSPQELGPVEVLLRLDGDRISADFISGHAETRQALEQGLPRLRDLLGEHGFQLAHAGVGGDAPASQEHTGRPGGDAFGDAADASIAPVSAHDAAPVWVSRGLLDAYA